MSKSYLNEYCQKSNLEYPKYIPEKAGDVFVARVLVDGTEYRSINGHSSKKEAEQEAAKTALANLVQIHPQVNTVQELLAWVEREKKGGGVSVSKKVWVKMTTSQDPSSSTQGSAATPTPNQPSRPSSAIQVPPSSTITAVPPPVSSLVPVPRPSLQGFPPTSPGFPLRPDLRASEPVSSPPPTNGPLPLSTSHNSPTASFFQKPVPTSNPAPRTIPVATATPSRVPSSSNSPHSIPLAMGPAGTPGSQRQLAGGEQAIVSSMSNMQLSTPPRTQPPPVHRPHAPFGQLMANFSPSSSRTMSNSQPTTPRYGTTAGCVRPMSRSPTPDVSTATPNPASSHVTGQLRSPAHFPPPLSTPPRVLPDAAKPAIINTADYDFVQCLDLYCKKYNSEPPLYHVEETRQQFRGSVKVGGLWYRGMSSLESFEGAKRNASLVALASLGIRAMGLMQAPSGGVVRGCGEMRGAAKWLIDNT